MIGKAEFHVVIPARYASERLHGKPLADIGGKPMIRHVWEKAMASGAASVVVATDDQKICDAVAAFSGEALLTRADHASGTDRIAEVAARRGWPDDTIVVNLQGDEPMMPPALIAQVAGELDRSGTEMATLATRVCGDREFHDPNVVKVVLDSDGCALYFSRAPIPWPRDPGADVGVVPELALRHLGIYAYRRFVLDRLVAAPPTQLERIEKLEQLRALCLGLRIRVAIATEVPGPGVDTPQDLETVRALVAQ